MPQQPFVMRVHFYLANGVEDQSLSSGAHHVAYIGSVEKHELLVDADRNTLESAAIHSRYAGERAGSLGYFGPAGADPQAARKGILAAQGPVWRVIASVGEADALNMGGDLTRKAGWEKAANTVVPKMVKQLGLDPAKVRWIAAAHRYQTHERNPHIHLLFWEDGVPTRKTAQWTDAERRAIRRAWITELYRPERERLGRAKTEARQAARAIMEGLTQGRQRELRRRLEALGAMLPGKGRLAYAYMPPPVKAETEALIRWLWDTDPALKAAKGRYLAAAEALGTFYWHPHEAKSHDRPGRQAALERMRENAEADLIRRLAGPVLRAARATRPDAAPAAGARIPSLSGALARLVRQAEVEARRTQWWLAEQQWRRRQAEAAIARATGAEWAG